MTAQNQSGTPTMTSDEVIERAETAAINAVVSRWGSDGVAMMEVAKVAAKAAIAVLPPAGVGEWQPIESAPKDGTEVLVAGGTRSHPDSTGGPEQFSGVSIARWSETWKQWDGESVSHDDCYSHEPTHWMPLPAPPAPTTEQGSTEPTNGDEG